MTNQDNLFWRGNPNGPGLPRILIVDDDPEIIEMLQHLLEHSACEIEAQYSGEEAWQALLSSQEKAGAEYDLILLDVMMAEMNGFELCERIKQHERFRFTPVLMMTALASVDNKALGLGAGADDYITKPFDPREMLARVGAMLRIRRMEQELRQRNRELAILNTITQSVASSLDLNQILTSAMNGIAEIVNVQAGYLVLLDAESGERCVYQQFTRQGHAEAEPNMLQGNIVDFVMDNRCPLLINDVPADPRFSGPSDGTIRSVLCVPLVVKDQTVGAIQVVNKHILPFEQNDQDLLLSIAASVAAAIENAQLYSDLAQSTKELERSQAQLIQAEKLAAVGRLAASIAHEINNPLQAIHNSLHLTLRPTLSEEKRTRFLAMAQEEVERLMDIVRRLLEFYRPSRGQRSATDINRVLENVLALTNKRLQHGGVKVETRLSPRLPPLHVVPDHIAQVFLNIVINAVEAMRQGGKLTIETFPSPEAQWVDIVFTDSGPGMDDETKTSIFEPFFTTKSTGTGLGLAISYGIIERHGGQIVVESTPGVGSTFTVRLPANHIVRTPEGGA